MENKTPPLQHRENIKNFFTGDRVFTLKTISLIFKKIVTKSPLTKGIQRKFDCFKTKFNTKLTLSKNFTLSVHLQLTAVC